MGRTLGKKAWKEPHGYSDVITQHSSVRTYAGPCLFVLMLKSHVQGESEEHPLFLRPPSCLLSPIPVRQLKLFGTFSGE